MNPKMVSQNRTARLVREGAKPAYTTKTPKREHVNIVEVEHETGYRKWVSEKSVSVLVEKCGYSVSDVDHSVKCWCFKEK